MEGHAVCTVCAETYKVSYGGCPHCGAVLNSGGGTSISLVKEGKPKSPMKGLLKGFLIGAGPAIVGLIAWVNTPVVSMRSSNRPAESVNGAGLGFLVLAGLAIWVGSLLLYWYRVWIAKANHEIDRPDPRFK